MKCQYAAPGTYGHECGSPATNVLITVMPEDTKVRLRCMGATDAIPADGLSRAGRCEVHRNVREFTNGRFVRTEAIPTGRPDDCDSHSCADCDPYGCVFQEAI